MFPFFQIWCQVANLHAVAPDNQLTATTTETTTEGSEKMFNWKKAIRKLAWDFLIPDERVTEIIENVDNEFKRKSIPPHYETRADFLYDKALTRLHALITAW